MPKKVAIIGAGSVPVVAMPGRNAVQLLCHADGQPFVTTTA